MSSWNLEVFDDLAAPEFSRFTEADVPPVSEGFPEAPHWLSNYVLNSVFGPRYRPEFRGLAIGFMRRAQNALTHYEEARSRTSSFLEARTPESPGLGRYFAALSSWESFVLQCQIAINLYNKLKGCERAFTEGDGSPESRLYGMANTIKHKSAELVPVWLTNSGLRSAETSLRFLEAAQILGEICRIADVFDNPGDALPNDKAAG